MGFSQAKADKICELIADGQSMRKACQVAKIDRSCVYDWLEKEPTFADQYARADLIRAQHFADSMLEIADDPDLDPNDKRIRVDARKWIASKLNPKRYGDRIDVTGTSTQQVIVRHVLHTREPTAIELEPHDVRLIEKK